MTINRGVLITLIDVLAFLAFVFVVTTGVLLHYILPPGSGRTIEVLGMNRHEWGDIHFLLSFAFLAVLAVHLFLHTRFIASVLRGHAEGGSRLRLALGLLGLLAVVALAAAPLLVPKETSEHTPKYQYRNVR